METLAPGGMPGIGGAAVEGAMLSRAVSRRSTTAGAPRRADSSASVDPSHRAASAARTHATSSASAAAAAPPSPPW
eukprot:scaffold90563_cov63-Phaeocystis_antarctica.AAC.5